MQMGQFRDGVAALVVVGALRRLPAVKVGDWDAMDERGQSGGEHLRPIAQNEYEVRRGPGEGLRKSLDGPTGGRRDLSRLIAGNEMLHGDQLDALQVGKVVQRAAKLALQMRAAGEAKHVVEARASQRREQRPVDAGVCPSGTHDADAADIA